MNSPFAAHQRLLRERLSLLLAPLHPLLKADVVQALESSGKLLASGSTGTPAGVWALLSFLVTRSVQPTIADSIASKVGIASECFVCALDLLDDIEDEDQTPVVQSLGTARVLNVSTTLLMLAQQSLISLQDMEDQRIPSERIVILLDAFQSYALRATTGQHRDLLAETRPAVGFTEEECFEIAEGKAGAIMGLVCALGAIVAGADDQLCAQFATMGTLLGIAHQLDNDSHDLYDSLQAFSLSRETTTANNERKSVKSDIARGKKTLPVVLAANRPDTPHSSASHTDEHSEAHKDALHESIIATWGICLLYRERARECLREIEAREPVDPALRILLGFE